MKNAMLFAVIAALALTSGAKAADTYTLDPAHTTVCFYVRHLGINIVPGKFKEFTGSLVLEGDTLKEAAATIQVQSVDTGVAARDTHLKTADFFDAAKYPVITFKSKRIEKDQNQLVVVADFTMRGVTKELRLPVTLNGPIKDPWGNMRVGLQAKAKLNRKDYGINYNQVLDSGVLAVADEVEISLNAEATKDTADKSTPAK